MTKCTYILPTKYDILVKQAFKLVESFIDTELDDISHYGKIGVPQEDRLLDLRNYYYLINYMIYVRQKIDQYIVDKGDGCIEDSEVKSFKELYKTDCIVTNKVCKQYTNQIIDLFLQLPSCDATPTYTWTVNDSCFTINDIEYAIGETLQKRLNNIVVETFYISPEATSSDIQSIVAVDEVTADSLIVSRLVSPNSTFCCNEPIYDAPLIEVTDATRSTIDLQWISNAPLYNVSITDPTGNVVFTEEGIEENSIQFTGLDENTTYSINITAPSCRGDNNTVIEVTTGPYIVTLIINPPIDNQITVSRGVETEVLYGETYNLSWFDQGEPYFIVSQVLIDNVDRTQDVLFKNTEAQLVGNPADIPAAGNITIPNITSDIEVVLNGEPGNTCTTIELKINGNNLTLGLFEEINL